MPHNTHHHPLFNTSHAGFSNGTTQPIPIQRREDFAPTPSSPAPRQAPYPVYQSGFDDHEPGEDRWISPDVYRLFGGWQERNYAWTQFAKGFRTHPMPPMAQDFVTGCLVLARSRNDIDEPVLYMVARNFPAQQLWVCRDTFGKTFMTTPTDFARLYLPVARKKRMRLRASEERGSR